MLEAIDSPHATVTQLRQVAPPPPPPATPAPTPRTYTLTDGTVVTASRAGFAAELLKLNEDQLVELATHLHCQLVAIKGQLESRDIATEIVGVETTGHLEWMRRAINARTAIKCSLIATRARLRTLRAQRVGACLAERALMVARLRTVAAEHDIEGFATEADLLRKLASDFEFGVHLEAVAS